MKKSKSIKLNFIMNVILTMSSFIFPLITFPYVSRILLPEGTGKVSFATSLISYFSMFAQLGIPTYGIRACAKVRDDKEELTRTTQELVIINFVMSVISYTALAVALMLVPRLREERALYIIVSLTIAFNVIGMEWMYKALEQYTYITIRSIIFKFVALIVMFVFVHQNRITFFMVQLRYLPLRVPIFLILSMPTSSLICDRQENIILSDILSRLRFSLQCPVLRQFTRIWIRSCSVL